ncbi:MAG: amidohydrolase family protein, partial [Woeseiaceae bacterium]
MQSIVLKHIFTVVLFTAAVQFLGWPVFAASDLIVINGDVFTVDPAAPKAQAFAVENGRFAAVGSNAKIRALADDDTVIIDAAGNTVTPGFVDGHSHVSGDSPVVAGVDLSYIADKDEWLRLIEAADQR